MGQVRVSSTRAANPALQPGVLTPTEGRGAKPCLRLTLRSPALSRIDRYVQQHTVPRSDVVLDIDVET